MEPSDAQIEAGILKLHQLLLEYTCRLVRLNAAKDIIDVASGIIVERNGYYVLLSAGHALETDGWHLETDVIFENANEVVNIPLSGVFTLEIIKVDAALVLQAACNVDFAFVILPIDRLKKAACEERRLKDETIAFPVYRGPLDAPPILFDEPYAYSSWNDVCQINALGTSVLERNPTLEFGMQYIGLSDDERYYHFKLARAHQGHDYYGGASGSPIVDTTGKIVSLLLRGLKEAGILRGLPLSKFLPTIDAAIASEENRTTAEQSAPLL